jgi:hypothetical protein
MSRVLAALLLILMWTLSGCVNFAPAAHYMDGHTQAIIEDCVEIGRVITPDSPVAPILRDLHWRASTRMKPWTTQLKRSQPALHIEVPRDDQDNMALLRENEMLETFEREIDAQSGLFGGMLPFGQGEGGLGAGLIGGLLSGGGGLGIAGYLLKQFMNQRRGKQEAEQEAARQEKAANRYMLSLNAVKETHPDAVKNATDDPQLRADYRERKANLAKQETANRQKMAEYLNSQS